MTNIISAVPANLVVDATAVVADANAVVFHDIAAVTPAAPAPAKSNISAYAELVSIVADRSNWEANAYRTSNDQLYALLQRCYALYMNMCADRATSKQLVADVDRYLKEELGVKLSDSTHTMSKVVKCVFGADRRRVSAYSIALRSALAAKVPVVDIPSYIRANGGVEELRLAKSPNAKSPKQKAEAAAATIEAHVLARFKLDTLVETLDAAKVGRQHVLIVTQDADGAFTANALVSASTAVNAALAAFYSQNKAQEAAAATQNKQADDNDAVSQHIQAAAEVVLQ